MSHYPTCPLILWNMKLEATPVFVLVEGGRSQNLMHLVSCIR